MKILVFIAGVSDPKWPVRATDRAMPSIRPDQIVLSPFDEAALELALQIRDANPATQIIVKVAGGPDGETLARKVAASNPDEIALLPAGDDWNLEASAHMLASQVEGAELVVIGREFGDCDPGCVAAQMAARLGRPIFFDTQFVEQTENEIRFGREREDCIERLAFLDPLVISTTNDERLRLRKPLMKNVMMSRKRDIPFSPFGANDMISCDDIELVGVGELLNGRNEAQCEFLRGDLSEQARKLADVISGHMT
ncbi:MAG: hypothetical protein V7676_12910 [Parasphingorhabdus sp.]|uniref:hypothetical protein n=1 Tax=Parasphingorhabdus sp. TaxID=2709688 RepID=UPI003002166E